jgi:hypothetical protein
MNPVHESTRYLIKTKVRSLRETLQLRLRLCGIDQTFPSAKAEQIRGNLAHLDLLTTISNPIPPMMPPDMLERVVSRVPITTMDLDYPIRRLSAQPIRIIMHIVTLSPNFLSIRLCDIESISSAVLRMSCRNISHCVANSAKGHWIP